MSGENADVPSVASDSPSVHDLAIDHVVQTVKVRNVQRAHRVYRRREGLIGTAYRVRPLHALS